MFALHSFSQRITAYFALPPTKPSLAFSTRDQVVLLAAAVLFQAVYFVFIPLGYECDASMYFAYAKSLINAAGGSYTYHRPPGFPIFLILTGQFLFDSFIITVIAQAVMGVLAPLLVYRSLAPLNRVTALACSGVFIISGIPFAAAKLMLATHLYMFLVVATIYAFSRYYFTNSPRFIYLTVFVGLAAMFTRWEAIFLLVFAIVAMFVIGRKTSRHLRHVFLGIAIVATIIGGWSFTRSIGIGEPALFGSLHNGSSRQLFWRLYGQLYPAVMRAEINLGLREESNIEGLIVKDDPVKGRILLGTRLIDVNNGPATRKFRSQLAEAIKEFPEIHQTLKKPLDEAYQPPGQPRIDFYHESFGQFEGNPHALADNMFINPNMFYTDYVFSLLNRKLGIHGTDKLLNGVILESIKENPVLLALMGKQWISIFGFDVEALINLQMPVFTFWGLYPYAYIPYNLGGCSESTLPPSMIDENLFDVRLSQSLPQDTFLMVSSFLRNMVRNTVGFLALLSWWIIPFSRHRIFLVFLAGSSVVMLGVIAVMAGGLYTRYEYSSIPLILITTSGAVFSLWEFYQRKFRSSAHQV